MTPPTAALPCPNKKCRSHVDGALPKVRDNGIHGNGFQVHCAYCSYTGPEWGSEAEAIRLHNLLSAPAVQATADADEAITALAKEIIITFVDAKNVGYYLAGVESVIRKAVSTKSAQVLNSAGFLGTEFGPHPRPRGANALSPMNQDAPWNNPAVQQKPAGEDDLERWALDHYQKLSEKCFDHMPVVEDAIKLYYAYKRRELQALPIWRCPFCNEAVSTCSLQRDHIQGCHDFPAVTREPTLYIIVRRGRIIPNHYLHREAADEGAAKLGGEVIALFTSLAAVSGKQEKER